MTQHLPAWTEVDLGAIRRNAARLQERAGVPLITMVKADAYGLGAISVARALGAQFDRQGDRHDDQVPWALGVARLDEARALRGAGCTSRIFCCTPLLADELAEAASIGLRPSLHRLDDIDTWCAIGGGPWHLSIDTGMSRAGASWRQVVANPTPLSRAISQCPPEAMFTHFHSADVEDGTVAVQERRLAEVRAALPSLPANLLVHSDNSMAIGGRAHGSPGHLARPGLELYGARDAHHLGLDPVVHLRARVVDLRDLDVGDSVSYLATWTASSARRIATVPIGYGDGYRQSLSNRAEVLIGGRRCPVVGRVTMDLTMIDVTDVACDLGTVVTLIGRDGDSLLTVDAVAERGALSPYELLVGLRLRLPRCYLGER